MQTPCLACLWGLLLIKSQATEINPIFQASHPFRALEVPGEAEQQLVRNGVHQVEKRSVLVQDVVQRRSLESQVLRT